MRYCKRCLNTDTRPNTSFDEQGLCPVCRFFIELGRKSIDWEARRAEIVEIARWGREHSKSAYDCIVPVSGGKDSTRQAIYARDELGLRPLLVSSVYPPEQLSETGAHNLSNLVELGFDTVAVGLNPQIWKKLMLHSFNTWGNWCKSTELALYSIPIHAAIAYKVPLVFLGENPLYLTGERESSDTGDANRMKYSNTLGGGRIDPFLIDGVSRKDLFFYGYPSDQDMEHARLRIVYLGYYLPDFNRVANAAFAVARGLRTREEPPEQTGDLWGVSGLDEDFRLVNQMIKRVKFGFGHVTEQTCEAINHGQMTREEAIDLVKRYDGGCDPRYIRRYCEYLGITEEAFWEVVERYRDPKIWKKDADGAWVLRREVGSPGHDEDSSAATGR